MLRGCCLSGAFYGVTDITTEVAHILESFVTTAFARVGLNWKFHVDNILACSSLRTSSIVPASRTRL